MGFHAPASKNTHVVPQCPVCAESFEKNDCVACRRCSTVHHPSCWEFTGRCSTYGCGSRTYQLDPVITERGHDPITVAELMVPMTGSAHMKVLGPLWLLFLGLLFLASKYEIGFSLGGTSTLSVYSCLAFGSFLSLYDGTENRFHFDGKRKVLSCTWDYLGLIFGEPNRIPFSDLKGLLVRRIPLKKGYFCLFLSLETKAGDSLFLQSARFQKGKELIDMGETLAELMDLPLAIGKHVLT